MFDHLAVVYRPGYLTGWLSSLACWSTCLPVCLFSLSSCLTLFVFSYKQVCVYPALCLALLLGVYVCSIYPTLGLSLVCLKQLLTGWGLCQKRKTKLRLENKY